MYNNIPSKYIITDLKNTTYKKTTFNGYKKTDVFNELTKNILSGNIEKSILWACELHCSHYTQTLYNKLVSIYIKHVNRANLKILPILFSNLKWLKNQHKTTDFRNNQYMRNNINDMVCLLTFSNKYKLPTFPKIVSEDFNMKNNKMKMISQNLDYIKHFLKADDDKNIIIPMSEIAHNLQNKGISKSFENCLFWTSWMMSYEQHFHKKKLVCASRNIKDIPVKLQNDFTWLLWDIILHLSKTQNDYIDLLYKMYRFDFKSSNKKQKLDFIIIAYILIIDASPAIDYNTPLIEDSKNINRIKIMANINYQYIDIVLNKSPQYSKQSNPTPPTIQYSPLFSKDRFSNQNHMEQFNKPPITHKTTRKPAPTKIQHTQSTTKIHKTIHKEPTLNKIQLDDYIPKTSKHMGIDKNVFSLKKLIKDTDQIIYHSTII